MDILPVCKVNIYLNDNSKLIAIKKLNEIEIKALSISKCIYCNNRYYNIESFAFNFEDSNTLEIFIKE